MQLLEQIEQVARNLEELRMRRGGRLVAVTLGIPDLSMQAVAVDALAGALARRGLVDVEIVARTAQGPIRLVALELVPSIQPRTRAGPS